MTEPAYNKDIDGLRLWAWNTHISTKVEEFSKIIEDDKIFDRYFGADYVEKITSKSEILYREEVKLSLLYLALMLVLFFFHSLDIKEFQFAWYGFKNVSALKELLLLVAVTLLPVVAVKEVYRKYLTAIANECIKKLHSREDSREFYSLVYIDNPFGWLVSFGKTPERAWHGISVILMLCLMFISLSFLAVVYVGGFLVLVSVVYNVITEPVSSEYVNYFVATYTALAIIFSWLIHAHKFPLPHRDLKFYSKLEKLKVEDPPKYQGWMYKEAEKANKRTDYLLFFWSTSIYALLFTGVSLYFFPEKFEDLSFFIFEGLWGAFFVIFFTHPIVSFIKTTAWRIWMGGDVDNSTIDHVAFGKYQKTAKFAYLLVPTLITVLFIIKIYVL